MASLMKTTMLQPAQNVCNDSIEDDVMLQEGYDNDDDDYLFVSGTPLDWITIMIDLGGLTAVAMSGWLEGHDCHIIPLTHEQRIQKLRQEILGEELTINSVPIQNHINVLYLEESSRSDSHEISRSDSRENDIDLFDVMYDRIMSPQSFQREADGDDSVSIHERSDKIDDNSTVISNNNGEGTYASKQESEDIVMDPQKQQHHSMLEPYQKTKDFESHVDATCNNMSQDTKFAAKEIDHEQPHSLVVHAELENCIRITAVQLFVLMMIKIHLQSVMSKQVEWVYFERESQSEHSLKEASWCNDNDEYQYVTTESNVRQ